MQPEFDPEIGNSSANNHTEHDDFQSFAGFRDKRCRLTRFKFLFGAKVTVSFGSFSGMDASFHPDFLLGNAQFR